MSRRNTDLEDEVKVLQGEQLTVKQVHEREIKEKNMRLDHDEKQIKVLEERIMDLREKLDQAQKDLEEEGIKGKSEENIEQLQQEIIKEKDLRLRAERKLEREEQRRKAEEERRIKAEEERTKLLTKALEQDAKLREIKMAGGASVSQTSGRVQEKGAKKQHNKEDDKEDRRRRDLDGEEQNRSQEDHSYYNTYKEKPKDTKGKRQRHDSEEERRAGRDRKREKEDAGNVKPRSRSQSQRAKKRVKFNEKTVLFVGDSQIKALVEEDALQYHAFKEGWDVRLKRGGTVQKIEDEVDQLGEELHKYKLIIISCGGNDLANTNRGEKSSDQIDKIVKGMANIAEKCSGQGPKTIFILPGPRRDVDEDQRQECIARCEFKIREVGAKTITMDIDKESREKFLQEAVEQKFGIHITFKRFGEILEDLFKKVGMPLVIEKSKHLDRADFFMTCWNCNGADHNRFDCQSGLRQCGRCKGEGHVDDTCLHLYKMCTRCGKRGHGRFKCTK